VTESKDPAFACGHNAANAFSIDNLNRQSFSRHLTSHPMRLSIALLLACALTAGVPQIRALVLGANLGGAPAPTAERLPDGYIRQAYYFQLTPPPHGTEPWLWRLVQGALPPGVALEPNGVLAGAPDSSGQFRFTLEAADSSKPKPLTETHDYVLTVPQPLSTRWTQPPRVTGEGAIAGELEVANGSGRPLDLTVIVVAVNTINKAFALGYQHFTIDPGPQRIPFGSTLPRGSYIVHADAIGEDADTLDIFRARLQTDPLTVP
jgi:Putative Ig domain